MKKDNKIYIFYHDPCLDGIGAAWAAYKKFGDSAKYIGAGYRSYENIRTELENETENSEIIFLDYAPSQEILSWIINKGWSIKILDHHEERFSNLNSMSGKKFECVLDKNRSGVGIAWDYFVQEERPLLVNIVEAMDLGRSEFFDSKEQYYNVGSFFDGLSLSKMEDVAFKFSLFDKFSRWTLDEFEKMGAEQRKKLNHFIPEALKKVAYIAIPEFGLNRLPCVNTDIYSYGGDLMRVIFEKYKSSVAFLWIKDGENSYRINIRTKGNVLAKDISAHIKGKLNCRGGGHPHAVVLRLTEDQFAEFNNYFPSLID